MFEIKTTIKFAIVCLLVGSLCHVEAQTDSLKRIWKNTTKIDSVRFNALKEYYEINNQVQPDSTLVSLDYYYNLAKEKNNTLELCRSVKFKGNIHRLKGNYDIALLAYKESEKLAIQLDNDKMHAGVLGNIGNVFIYNQDYVQATRYFSNALKIYQQIGDKDGESHILTSLGSVFLIIQNYNLALEYYQKALDILNNRGFEDRRTAIIFINIGWVNFEKKLFEESTNYYKKGLKILQIKNDKFFIAECYSVLAQINLELRQLEIAEDYAQKNFTLNKELGIEPGIIGAEIIFAKLLFETNVDKAALMAESILVELPTNSFREYKRDLYELLYQCYKSQNKLDLSLKMHENYKLYNDSIQVEKNSFAVTREAVKNDFDLRLKESKEKSEKEKGLLKIKQRQKIWGVFSASAIIVVLIFFYFRAKNKKNIAKKDALLEEIEKLKSKADSPLISETKKYELDRTRIESHISRKLNDTDWKVLNILLDDPVIPNKEIAQKAFMSADGIGSSLRRMYEYFDVKDSKYKKISLLMMAIKVSK